MKQMTPAVIFAVLGMLAGLTACSGAHRQGQGQGQGSGHGPESTAALGPNGGRGGVASPWLDDPKSYQGPASNETAPVTAESESSEEEADGLGDGGGDAAGSEGGDDLGEDASEPEIEIEEGWGGDEDWEEDPGDE